LQIVDLRLNYPRIAVRADAKSEIENLKSEITTCIIYSTFGLAGF